MWFIKIPSSLYLLSTLNQLICCQKKFLFQEEGKKSGAVEKRIQIYFIAQFDSNEGRKDRQEGCGDRVFEKLLIGVESSNTI